VTITTPHHTPGSPQDLGALTRYWQWERTVKTHLQEAIAGLGVRPLFQPIFFLDRGIPICRGFEALARFAAAPEIPVGLWFRVARELGEARGLELAAIRAALPSIARLPDGCFLSVNSSIDLASEVIEMVPAVLRRRLLLDIPFAGLFDHEGIDTLDSIAPTGTRIAIDDVPLECALDSLDEILAIGPAAIKVDVLTDADDISTAGATISELVDRCHQRGVTVIAERVEKVTHLTALIDHGLEWAQGFSLSRPVEL
jgi:EAL domain-containing protein (putative c-di-GMP-specific phosphodiesterase class I)